MTEIHPSPTSLFLRTYVSLERELKVAEEEYQDEIVEVLREAMARLWGSLTLRERTLIEEGSPPIKLRISHPKALPIRWTEFSDGRKAFLCSKCDEIVVLNFVPYFLQKDGGMNLDLSRLGRIVSDQGFRIVKWSSGVLSPPRRPTRGFPADVWMILCPSCLQVFHMLKEEVSDLPKEEVPE